MLVAVGKIGAELQGTVLLDAILDAKIVNVVEGDHDSIRPVIYRIADEYRKKGYNPFVIDDLGPSGPLGSVAYVQCALEVSQQLEEQGVIADYLVVASGAGGTHAGLALGARLLGAPFKVLGISVRRRRDEIMPSVADRANGAAAKLAVAATLSADEVLVDDRYVGKGYGIPTDLGIEAIRLVAKTEGLILDPTYTGKVMSGLIALIRQGYFPRGSTVVYLHTGGTPIIFARGDLPGITPDIQTTVA